MWLTTFSMHRCDPGSPPGIPILPTCLAQADPYRSTTAPANGMRQGP